MCVEGLSDLLTCIDINAFMLLPFTYQKIKNKKAMELK